MTKQDQVMKLHSEGFTIRKIARMTKLGKSTVHNYIKSKKANIEIKTREFNASRLEEIRNYKAEGHSVRQIAKLMNISKSNVQYHINKIYDNYEPASDLAGTTPLKSKIIQFYKEGKSKNEVIGKFNKRLKGLILTEIAWLSRYEIFMKKE